LGEYFDFWAIVHLQGNQFVAFWAIFCFWGYFLAFWAIFSLLGDCLLWADNFKKSDFVPLF
jgi:hypothetical protein